ncbi:MAG TPA: flagellar basal body rod protein FlgB [Candidatus Acidoferrales bacterium]|nr:flagellar basal body rod protein FlgB [Candidatus Acidoferrales bacterium]
MAGISFGTTSELLKDALGGASLEHAAVANNIANVNTPGYQTFEVAYKQALAATEPTPPDPNELTLVTDQPNQISVNGEIPAQPFHVAANRVDNPIRMRVDGSNVDLDQQMAELTQNSAYQQTMAQFLTTQYTRIRQAITEQA